MGKGWLPAGRPWKLESWTLPVLLNEKRSGFFIWSSFFIFCLTFWDTVGLSLPELVPDWGSTTSNSGKRWILFSVLQPWSLFQRVFCLHPNYFLMSSTIQETPANGLWILYISTKSFGSYTGGTHTKLSTNSRGICNQQWKRKISGLVGLHCNNPRWFWVFLKRHFMGFLSIAL